MASMTYTRGIAQPFTSPAQADAWVHEVLEPEQLSSAKNRFGRAKLSTGTIVLLWGLRIYVVLMTLLIGLEVSSVLYPGWDPIKALVQSCVHMGKALHGG